MAIHEDIARRDNPNPTESEVRTGIGGNICRCTGYAPIVKAIVETGTL